MTWSIRYDIFLLPSNSKLLDISIRLQHYSFTAFFSKRAKQILFSRLQRWDTSSEGLTGNFCGGRRFSMWIWWMTTESWLFVAWKIVHSSPVDTAYTILSILLEVRKEYEMWRILCRGEDLLVLQNCQSLGVGLGQKVDLCGWIQVFYDEEYRSIVYMGY